MNWICDLFTKKGYECIKGKTGPDISIPKINTAIEVELGSSDIARNIRHNILNFDTSVICSDDKKLIQSLSSQFKSKKIFFVRIPHLPAFVEKMPVRN